MGGGRGEGAAACPCEFADQVMRMITLINSRWDADGLNNTLLMRKILLTLSLSP